MDPISNPVAVTRALREARQELSGALLASTLTRPTRAAEAVCQHVTGAAALLDAVLGAGARALVVGEVLAERVAA